MRRGVGLAGLQKAALAKEQFRTVGDEVKKSNLQAMKDQMSLFQTKLEEFALKHRAEIRRDPAFRAQFHMMCANIGVDPLASNKGIWAKTLGIGDFYYELSVQIVEACWATRDLNGGLMELPALIKYVNRRRGRQADPISEDDVVRAIKKIKVLGSGFDLVLIGRMQFVRSVPGELNMDSNKILELAQAEGFVSRALVMHQAGWQAQRVEAALQVLLKQGIALVDDQAPNGERLFWFPCLAPNQG